VSRCGQELAPTPADLSALPLLVDLLHLPWTVGGFGGEVGGGARENREVQKDGVEKTKEK
jgi:hypothetical protein